MNGIKQVLPFYILSRIYDTLAYDIDYAAWARYLIDLIGVSKIKLLEYACGTGNLTKYLINYSSETVALDISPEMLEIAEQKLRHKNSQIRLVCNNMVDFRLNKPVDTIICALDGVNYILDYNNLLKYFNNAYENLEYGGTLLFDISSPYKIEQILGNSQYFDDADEQTLLWQNSFDKNSSIVKMDLSLFINCGDNYKRYDETHFQRAWSIKEIMGALNKAKFSNVSIYKFGTCEKVGETDERIQFKALKGEV